MNKKLLLLATIALAGCSAGMTTAKVSTPIAPPTTPPVVTPPPVAPKPKVVWFYGDQVTSGWPFTDATWVNKAVAGQNSAQTFSLMKSDLLGSHPDVIHLLTGDSDSLTGIPVNMGADTIANIQAMVTLAQDDNIPIVVGTPAPLSLSSYANPHPPQDEILDAVGFYIMTTVAKEANVTVVDYFTPLTGNEGCSFLGYCNYAPGYSTDGMVPNVVGYGLMTPLATKAIQADELQGESK